MITVSVCTPAREEAVFRLQTNVLRVCMRSSMPQVSIFGKPKKEKKGKKGKKSKKSKSDDAVPETDVDQDTNDLTHVPRLDCPAPPLEVAAKTCAGQDSASSVVQRSARKGAFVQ